MSKVSEKPPPCSAKKEVPSKEPISNPFNGISTTLGDVMNDAKIPIFAFAHKCGVPIDEIVKLEEVVVAVEDPPPSTQPTPLCPPKPQRPFKRARRKGGPKFGQI